MRVQLFRHLVLSVLLALITTSAGCNVFGWFGQAVEGPETKGATFTMAKRTTAVIAEKFSNPSDAVMDDEPIARFITQDLREHNTVPLVDTVSIYGLRSSDPAKWRASTMASIGRGVGADQVLYINLLDVNVEVAPGSDMMRGKATVMVRVVDCKTGSLIWPIGATEGYPVSSETKLIRKGENNVYESGLRTTLQRELATKIAQLFYPVTKEF